MIGSLSPQHASHALEFGMYRDGDNNLDAIQSLTIVQARQASKDDPSIEFTVEDTTSRRGFDAEHVLRTESYTIADGDVSSNVRVSPPHDMSARQDLAAFVAHTLDNAEKSGAKATWLDLIDHGGGDGGGLQSTHSQTGIMREDDIAGAIADGVASHAASHPEDAGRIIDGVVANQCLMATVAFSSALSHAGVRYLAASPETMLAPGVPTGVAHDIARHLDDPHAMARDVVAHTMRTTYGGKRDGFAPAAAFDVFDLAPEKATRVERSVAALDGALVAAIRGDRGTRTVIREDARAIDGMVRFPEGKSMPWRADRPAIALYQTLSEDGRLSAGVRGAAAAARDAVAATVLAHKETDNFAPFGDADYSDAYGPTVHFPVARGQVDTWAPKISETDNAFYKAVGAADLTKVVA
ncbi:MAG: hypothetical protein NVSMB19_23390 [Vulcanimicrobiaceae bacterium]